MPSRTTMTKTRKAELRAAFMQEALKGGPLPVSMLATRSLPRGRFGMTSACTTAASNVRRVSCEFKVMNAGALVPREFGYWVNLMKRAPQPLVSFGYSYGHAPVEPHGFQVKPDNAPQGQLWLESPRMRQFGAQDDAALSAMLVELVKER